MKTQLTLLFALFICLAGKGNGTGLNQESPQAEDPKRNELHLMVSPVLNDLAKQWKTAYQESHPGRQVVIEMNENLENPDPAGIYLVTEKEVAGKTFWKMCVGFDIIVPVTHSSNPYLQKIRETGITPVSLAGLMNETKGWNEFSGDNNRHHAKGYITDDPGILSALADYLKIDVSGLSRLKRLSPGELPEKIGADIYAFGFCRLSEVIDPTDKLFAGQLAVIPVDRNGNGRMDVFENVYSSPETLIRGVWTGKYPGQLTEKIYVLAQNKPADHLMLDFLSWISEDGQEMLSFNGFSKIAGREKAANMILISDQIEPVYGRTETPLLSGRSIGFFLLMLVILFAAGVFLSGRKKAGITDAEDLEVTPVFNENSVLAPAGLYYDKTHTWAFMEKEGRVKVGIDDFMQHVTGKVTHIKMKKPGEKVIRGEKLVTIIREGKHLDFYSPVNGIIVQKNELLEKNPSMMASDPYINGWAYEIEPTNWSREIRYLFMAGKYREWLNDEFMRLKDFLAASANRNAGVYAHVVLQDGGELTDHVLADLGPEVWDDFQTKFIDSSR